MGVPHEQVSSLTSCQPASIGKIHHHETPQSCRSHCARSGLCVHRRLVRFSTIQHEHSVTYAFRLDSCIRGCS